MTTLPPNIEAWFAHRGWTPREHQLAMVQAAVDQTSALLIAPTGAGKTLAGFLPTLVELAERPRQGLHTLYISPLKALAVDIHRNLERPIAELRLPIRAETRTGDTPDVKKQRQRKSPPQILMTTPESLALLLAYPDAEDMFRPLRTIVIDELHALAGIKRGDLLSLGLARLASLAPAARRVGLSATVAQPNLLRGYLSKTGADATDVRLIRGRAGARPEISVLETRERMPWSGHMAVHAMPEVYERIKETNTTIVFVNTRAQAELCFQALWRVNEDNLPIGLHHGSLAIEQRRKIEGAMSRGELRAVVATSSLDLGIDWGSVDLVVQVGAPKGASRLMQRIGRANHRLDEPSRALLVPGNRFEHLECRAAIDAIDAGELDGDPVISGGLDVLAQHVLGTACAGPFDPDALYREVLGAAPYFGLARKDFDDVVDFVATGGYALGAYERFKRLKKREDGHWELADKSFARAYRLNVGTIVESTMLKVRINRGPVVGEVEEYFGSTLVQGDTFVFGGQLLRFVGIKDMVMDVVRGGQGEPKVPAYAGGRMPLTTLLADRVRGILHDPSKWPALPEAVREWLELQRWRSTTPSPDALLVETFPRGDREYMVAYCFEGRQAHQTLGMLISRRMERMGLGPLGFVATDYSLATWSLRSPTTAQLVELFDEDMLGDDLESWMDESSYLRRTFRNVAVIAGLIERQLPGQRKNTRQVTFSSDLIYEVLRKHEPDHVLLRATRHDAARGLTDIERVALLLKRARHKIEHRALDRVSPLAVPVLLEIGREAVHGEARDAMLEEAEADLVQEATALVAEPRAPKKSTRR
ncbi:ligase-associated DNA damage response DEXH box helicase [Roseiterribacter gracilis]|uniref:DNA ligase-associated DEXH box helicase n=1 Tax=Roseiterribacter gracilis TaxID=2812848 RepID=A0A8S8X7H3_9PROT|nr:DNA ligase-associated DEXH box helicase [Rhodospirillales bacterium TMPK1]